MSLVFCLYLFITKKYVILSFIFMTTDCVSMNIKYTKYGKQCLIFCMQHKCEQYWPEEGSKQCGAIRVTLSNTKSLAHYKIRTFSMEQVIILFCQQFCGMWCKSTELMCVMVVLIIVQWNGDNQVEKNSVFHAELSSLLSYCWDTFSYMCIESTILTLLDFFIYYSCLL